MNLNYIVIEGNIGAGKTTLSKMIAKEYNAKLILEQFADNPFLPKFYKEPDKFSFQLELSFLAERYQQLNKELTSRDLFKTFTVADYFFMKSLIFAGATLKEDEYNLYRQIFNIIYKSTPKPDLYVYLHVDVKNLANNIAKRGRDYEKEINETYLLKLQEGYFDFFKQQNDIRYLIIDSNNMDFVENPGDYTKVKELIFKNDYPVGINRITI
ncbi:MAG: deoxynucleoside kinase [Bacteroidales bacterium]|nr:deoxynucleoside kinase [Bacteroidales bacterium]